VSYSNIQESFNRGRYSGGRETEKLKKNCLRSPRALGSIMMSTDVSLGATRKLAAGFGDFGAVASGWWPSAGRHGRGSRRPALAWAGPLDWYGQAAQWRSRATRFARRQSSVGAAGGRLRLLRWHGRRLDGSTRAIQPHRIPALHCPGLSSHARIALWHVRWMSAAWVWAAAAASRLPFAPSRWVRAGCTSCSTARLSTVTPPRGAPPSLSFPACASPS
jgi:hypothetical protein